MGLAGIRHRCRNGARHTAIDHIQLQAVLACQHAHRRTALEKVVHHLPGHVAGIGRHAACRQPVVCRAHQHLRCLQLRLGAAQNHAKAQHQRLQLPERTQRLGFLVNTGLQAGTQIGVVQRRNGRKGKIHIKMASKAYAASASSYKKRSEKRPTCTAVIRAGAPGGGPWNAQWPSAPRHKRARTAASSRRA